jgi:aldose 1-epimerase
VRPPSGLQYELVFGDQTAVVTEVGGGLRTYTVGTWSVLDGYAIDEMSTGGRGQVLMPWPNRLQDGRYEFGGRTHQVPLNELERSNAIHGLVRWMSWTRAHDGPQRVLVSHELNPQPGYPFTLALQIEYGLSERGLRVTTRATNVGADPCPFGAGAHPYVSVGTETVDDVLLRIPAATVLHSDDRALPVGSGPVQGTDLDFRAERRIGAARLDHCFTDLERDELAIAQVELRDGADRSLRVWVDESYPYVMVFTGDLPDVARRGLAVEPMSCPPNAFSSGEGVVVLEPGGSWTGTWGIEPQ